MITAKNTAFIVAAALFLSAFATTSAQAEGDAAQGKLLAYTCMGCHGIPGYRNAYPSYRVPKLGGQKAGYMEDALKAYRSGIRPHPTMQAQGDSLTDQDIEDLAAWFQGDDYARDTVTAAELQANESLAAAQTCLACHGEAAAEGLVPVPPTLSGQHEDYLIHALNQYKNGTRSGNIMLGFAASLTDADIEAIARFYSRRDGLETPTKED